MHENSEEVHSSLVLNSHPTIGPLLYQELLGRFGTALKAIQEGPKRWGPLNYLKDQKLERLISGWDEARKKADQDCLELDKDDAISVVLWQSKSYPSQLKQIHSPPPIIYVKAQGEDLESLAVAVVGSRRCSYYGSRVAKELSTDLADEKVVTVSGLARGIDRVVHEATLAAGGKTWAVLGSGLSQIYPPENRKLAEQISQSGALISEFPLQTKPFPPNFPRRNRIIAGLSYGTVIVEGSEKSGSLITARLAANEGREVFAVPGPITSPLSAASHLMIESGAKLVRNTESILEEIPISARSKRNSHCASTSTLDKREQDILLFMGSTPILKEKLASGLKEDLGELSPLLLNLELKGLIQALPGGFLVKSG